VIIVTLIIHCDKNSLFMDGVFVLFSIIPKCGEKLE